MHSVLHGPEGEIVKQTSLLLFLLNMDTQLMLKSIQ